MTEDKQARMLEKIRLLLAKAQSTTPAEAEALTEHAERLMVRHGIDQAMMRAAMAAGQKAPEEIISRRCYLHGRYNRAHLQLWHAVGQNMGCQTLQSTGPDMAIGWVYGYETDVAQAIQLFESLLSQLDRAAKVWWKDERNTVSTYYATEQRKFILRRGFRIGFAVRVGQRLATIRTSTIRDIQNEGGTGAELVLLNRDQAVAAFVQRENGKLKPARGGIRDIGSDNALRAGARAADRSDIGAKRIANPQQLEG